MDGQILRDNTVPADQWLLVGGLTATSAEFRIKLSPSTTSSFSLDRSANNITKLVVSKSADLIPLVVEQDIFQKKNNNSTGGSGGSVLAISVGHLEPQTRYFYAVVTVNNVATSPNTLTSALALPGTFLTPALPQTRYNFTIAATGCAWTGSRAPIFDTIRRDHPDLQYFLHLGDLQYADSQTEDLNDRLDIVSTVLHSAPQSDLFRSTALVYMWDDHDYLGNGVLMEDGGSDKSANTARETALDSFSVAFPHYPLAGSEPTNSTTATVHHSRPGVYQAFTVGTVRFLLSDLRSEATPASIYSDKQAQWLAQELEQAGNYDYVAWVTTKPWIGQHQGDWDDSWAAHPENRAELSTMISNLLGGKDGPQNLIAISADAHMVALDDGSNTFYGKDRTVQKRSNSNFDNKQAHPVASSFPILQSGPLDRLGSNKGGPFTGGCYGLSWERTHQYSTLSFEFVSGDQQDETLESACIHIQSFRVVSTNAKQTLLDQRLYGPLFRPAVSSDNHSEDSVCKIDRLSASALAWVICGVVATMVVSVWTCLLRPRTPCFIDTFLGGALSALVGLSYLGTIGMGLALPYLTRGMTQYSLQPILILGFIQSASMGLVLVHCRMCGFVEGFYSTTRTSTITDSVDRSPIAHRILEDDEAAPVEEPTEKEGTSDAAANPLSTEL